LRFIQVVCSNSGGAGSALVSTVDNNQRANPFYGEGGRVISLNIFGGVKWGWQVVTAP
jgi:hypothetical protein